MTQTFAHIRRYILGAESYGQDIAGVSLFIWAAMIIQLPPQGGHGGLSNQASITRWSCRQGLSRRTLHSLKSERKQLKDPRLEGYQGLAFLVSDSGSASQ